MSSSFVSGMAVTILAEENPLESLSSAPMWQSSGEVSGCTPHPAVLLCCPLHTEALILHRLGHGLDFVHCQVQ